MPHTDCRMASGEEADVHHCIAEKFGVDTRSMEIRTVDRPADALITDVVRVRAYPLLPADLVVGERSSTSARAAPAHGRLRRSRGVDVLAASVREQRLAQASAPVPSPASDLLTHPSAVRRVG